jgi:hypothetical protein
MFRLVSPASTGAASYVPDALLVLIVFKAGFDLAVGRVERRNAMRWLAAPLLLFLAIAVVSWLGHGAGVRSLFAAMRQYLRFPVWALALAACGIGWQHARRMMWILLGVALLQLPFALHEIGHPINAASLLPGTHFFAGDNISGTFGLGGSNSAMVFLTLAALVWLALVLYRVVPAWVLMIVAPAIVIPMALGSAAVFVLLLPAAVIALLVRASLTRGAPITVGVLVAGALVLGLVGFGARSFALAPGLNGTSQVSAASALNVDYLNAYVTETSGAGPSRRLGFLSVALHSTVFDGAQRAFLGLGPQTAVIGMQDVQVGPTSLSVLATASVQSVPRILLGFGVLGLIAYMILLVMPGLKMSGLEGVDRTARALALMLPVATGVYVLAGFYNAAWSDPGISCAYWTIVLATYAGSRPISPSVEGALR